MAEHKLQNSYDEDEDVDIDDEDVDDEDIDDVDDEDVDDPLQGAITPFTPWVASFLSTTVAPVVLV